MNKTIKDLDKFLDNLMVKKLPALPDNIKEIFVKYYPLVVVIGLIFSIPAVLVALGINALFLPANLIFPQAHTGFFLLGTIVWIASLVLQAMALPGLMKRSLVGWRYIYYSVLVYAVYALLNFSIFNLILSSGISFYFLFQTKKLYK